MKRDPVCGSVLDVREATVVSRYRDRYRYFCSLGCRDAFLRAPRLFIRPPVAKSLRKSQGRKKIA